MLNHIFWKFKLLKRSQSYLLKFVVNIIDPKFIKIKV